MAQHEHLSGGQFVRLAFVTAAFIVFWVAAWGLLGWIIYESFGEINFSLPAGQVIWTIFRDLGVAFPLTLFIFGAGCLYLARGLWQTHTNSYEWAVLLLAWTFIILILLLLASATSDVLSSMARLSDPPMVNPSTILLAVIALMAATFFVLISIHHVFIHADETIDYQTHSAWRFLLPGVIILAFLGGYPLEQIVISSFSNESFGVTRETDFVGGENYERLLNIRIDSCDRFETVSDCEDFIYDNFQQHDVAFEFNLFGTTYLVSSPDTKFVQALWDTLIFTLISVTLELILGLMLAQVLIVKFRGLGLMRMIALIPYAVPTIVSTLFWGVMLTGDRAGLLNQLLLSLGVINTPVSWLTDRTWQLPMLIFVDVWKTTPYMAFFLIPGLLTIPKEVYEAAAVDGAGRIRRFFTMTLPITMPFIGVAVLFRALNAIRVFDVFQLLVGARRFSLASYTQDVLIDGDMGYSSATGVIMFVIITILVIFYLRTQRVQAD